MKKLTLILLSFFAVVNLFAQVPQGINYQAVVRDSEGELIVNQEVSFKISIYRGDLSGSPLYTETHTVTTDVHGLAALVIGEGSTSDDFASIPWSAGSLFMETAFDPDGGDSYISMGASSLLSVPYAFYADKADSSVMAQQALEALYAGGAAIAENAEFAVNAEMAVLSDTAEFAYNAANALAADYAQHAGDALTAEQALHADTADYALNEDDKIAFSSCINTNIQITGRNVRPKIVFDSITYNLGNGYNAGTGIFTVPVSGVYQFNTSVYFTNIDFSVNSGRLYIYVNDEMHKYLDVGKEYRPYKGSLSVLLDEGDTVDIRVSSFDNNYLLLGVQPHFIYFTGHLIYRD